jgi:hypothetical protein
MKKARLTEEQIIGILREHEAGAKCADLCRKHGMSLHLTTAIAHPAVRDESSAPGRLLNPRKKA